MEHTRVCWSVSQHSRDPECIKYHLTAGLTDVSYHHSFLMLTHPFWASSNKLLFGIQHFRIIQNQAASFVFIFCKLDPSVGQIHLSVSINPSATDPSLHLSIYLHMEVGLTSYIRVKQLLVVWGNKNLSSSVEEFLAGYRTLG